MSETMVATMSGMSADAINQPGAHEGVVRLGKLWADSVKASRAFGTRSADFLRMLVDVIMAIVRRIARLFGVSLGESATSSSESLDVVDESTPPEVKFTGDDPEMVAKATAAAEEIVEGTIRELIMSAESFKSRMDEPGMDLWLLESLMRLKEHHQKLLEEHAQVLESSREMFAHAGVAMNVETEDEAYVLLGDAFFEGKGLAQLVDRDGQARDVIQRLRSIEDEIKLTSMAMVSYCAAGREHKDLAEVVESFLSVPDAKVIAHKVAQFSGSDSGENVSDSVENGDNSVSQVVNSGNDEVIDFAQAAATRAKELPAKFSPELSEADRIPLQLTRPEGGGRFGRLLPARESQRQHQRRDDVSTADVSQLDKPRV